VVACLKLRDHIFQFSLVARLLLQLLDLVAHRFDLLVLLNDALLDLLLSRKVSGWGRLTFVLAVDIFVWI
jgi:hypothetical protein